MNGETIIGGLRREHAGMRSVLVLLEQQLNKLDKMGAAQYVLLANALYYLRKFPGSVHHPKEDMIFGRLAELDPVWKGEVETLLQQHREIYALEDELIEAALDSPAPGSEAAAQLLEKGRRYLNLQRRHSETEERVLFPQALATLKSRDWAAIAARVRSVEDPLFGQHAGERYRLLYQYIMREALES